MTLFALFCLEICYCSWPPNKGRHLGKPVCSWHSFDLEPTTSFHPSAYSAQDSAVHWHRSVSQWSKWQPRDHHRRWGRLALCLAWWEHWSFQAFFPDLPCFAWLAFPQVLSFLEDFPALFQGGFAISSKYFRDQGLRKSSFGGVIFRSFLCFLMVCLVVCPGGNGDRVLIANPRGGGLAGEGGVGVRGWGVFTWFWEGGGGAEAPLPRKKGPFSINTPYSCVTGMRFRKKIISISF